MSREEELKQEINNLEEQIKPLRKELNNIWKEKAEEIKRRLLLSQTGKGDFTSEELIYAATVRCDCGAGMAYPKDVGVNGAWECSNILLGIANREVLHSSELPFAFYEVKSENQPSANNQTTRPKE